MEFTVGTQQRSDGTTSTKARMDRKSSLVVQAGGGQYSEMAKRGNLFWSANTAAVTLTVALATTYTGLVVNNPPGNIYHYSILQVGWGWSVAPVAIASMHLGTGYSGTEVTHTTPLAVNSSIIGGGGGTAKVDASATLPVAPKYTVPLIGGFTAGALPAQPQCLFDIGGAIILPPGAYAMIIALTAAIGFGYMLWEEYLPGA